MNYTLSDSDREILQAAVKLINNLPINVRGALGDRVDTVLVETNTATETYVAQAGEDGIAGATRYSSGVLLPGRARCDVHQVTIVDGTYRFEAVEEYDVEVFNVSTSEVPPGGWVAVWKDKYGRWVTYSNGSPYTVYMYTPSVGTGTTGIYGTGTGTGGDETFVQGVHQFQYPSEDHSPTAPVQYTVWYENYYGTTPPSPAIMQYYLPLGVDGDPMWIRQMTTEAGGTPERFFEQFTIDNTTMSTSITPGQYLVDIATGAFQYVFDVTPDGAVMQFTVDDATGTGSTRGTVEYREDGAGGIEMFGTNVSLAGSLEASAASYAYGSLAATGSVQGDAAAIVTDGVYATDADGTKGIILSNSRPNCAVYNSSGTSTLKVYPPSGAQIIGAGTDVAIVMNAAASHIFRRVDENEWAVVRT